MSTLLNEILQESESSSCSSPDCACKHCSDARNEISQESKSLSYHSPGCTCGYCLAGRNQRPGETLFTLEIGIPVSEMSSEFEVGSLRAKVRECLRKFQKIYFPLSVRPSENIKEIVLEVPAQVVTNRTSGNRFKNRIGNYLRQCLQGTKASVLIEGDRDKGNRKVSISERVTVNNKPRMRFVDVRVVRGREKVNIEAKKGGSRYHRHQRLGDADLKRTSRGSTLVVRNCPENSIHPDCVNLRNRGSQNKSEITLLNEILNEFEITVRPTLRNGSTGANVVYLQKRLNYHNSSIIPLKEDGIWGPKTNHAILFFQRMKLIKVDGIVGPVTWGKLHEPASPPRYYPPVSCSLPRPPIVAELEAPTIAQPLQRPKVRTCCLLAPATRFTPVFVDVNNLGTHNGTNEISGLVYTGKAGFIDIGHLRDICDLTKFVYDQMRAGVGHTSANPILTTQGNAVLHFCPRDELKVAMSIAYHDSLAHEITTYTDLNPGGHNSSFSPEDLCSNNIGTIVAEKTINSILISSTGKTFNGEVTKIIPDILKSLDAQIPAESQKAFDKINGRWVDFTGATSLLSLRYLKRRNFSHLPWQTGHKSDSTTPSWLTGDPLLLSRLYSYTNFVGKRIKDNAFPGEISTIRSDAMRIYGNDFDKP
jgi:hypothetical protein